MTAWGLIAGLQFEEMQMMAPGVILDMYVYRRNYDDMEHGVRRRDEQAYDL